MPVHSTGLWVDDATGDVVSKPPKTGTQLVAKGGEFTQAHRDRLERLGVTVDDQGQPVEVEDQPDAEPEPVKAEPVKATKAAKKKAS